MKTQYCHTSAVYMFWYPVFVVRAWELSMWSLHVLQKFLWLSKDAHTRVTEKCTKWPCNKTGVLGVDGTTNQQRPLGTFPDDPSSNSLCAGKKLRPSPRQLCEELIRDKLLFFLVLRRFKLKITFSEKKKLYTVSVSAKRKKNKGEATDDYKTYTRRITALTES